MVVTIRLENNNLYQICKKYKSPKVKKERKRTENVKVKQPLNQIQIQSKIKIQCKLFKLKLSHHLKNYKFRPYRTIKNSKKNK